MNFSDYKIRNKRKANDASKKLLSRLGKRKKQGNQQIVYTQKDKTGNSFLITNIRSQKQWETKEGNLTQEAGCCGTGRVRGDVVREMGEREGKEENPSRSHKE